MKFHITRSWITKNLKIISLTKYHTITRIFLSYCIFTFKFRTYVGMLPMINEKYLCDARFDSFERSVKDFNNKMQ